MAVAIAKTPAETQLAERFNDIAPQLPGGAAALEARRSALAAFSDLGLPHRRVEEYKYTDIRQALKDVGQPSLASGALDAAGLTKSLGPLADIDACRLVLVDGIFAPDLSAQDTPSGAVARAMAVALSEDGNALETWAALPEPVATGLAALNTAYVTDGIHLDVDAGATIDKPILIAHVRTTGETRMTTTRNVISVGDGADVTVIEAFVGAGATDGEGNAATRVSVGDRAKFSHVKVITQVGVRHVGNWAAELGAEAEYRPFFFAASPALARNNLFIVFGGENTALDASGCFLARGREHIDNTLWIDHAVPSCQSRELFKGVLDDSARAVFQGKVVVQQIAQKTDGKQMAQALMLSPTCEFDSKPELEIYADDVLCGHGSTCAELDPDLVFYLRARGIPEATARALLMDSFVAEAIEKIEHTATAEAVQKLASAWLAELTHGA